METHTMTDLFTTPRRSSPRIAELKPAPRGALSREQVVDQIMAINQSATAGYLAQFSHDSLGTYLDHLLNCQQPRGAHARWDRPGDAPAIMSRARRN
jgi:hypothetical protein